MENSSSSPADLPKIMDITSFISKNDQSPQSLISYGSIKMSDDSNEPIKSFGDSNEPFQTSNSNDYSEPSPPKNELSEICIKKPSVKSKRRANKSMGPSVRKKEQCGSRRIWRKRYPDDYNVLMAKPWGTEEVFKLLKRIRRQLPTYDMTAINHSVRNIQWGDIAFDCYTPEECRSEFKFLMHQVKTVKTLTTVVNEVEEKLKNGQLHDYCVLEPQQQFYKDYIEAHKNTLPQSELLKSVHAAWMTLPSAKKDKYLSQYMDGSTKMDIVPEDHPPPFPKNPFELYYNEECMHEGLRGLQFRNEVRKKYETLSIEKKLDLIAISAAHLYFYDRKANMFRKKHPEWSIPIHRGPSRAESELYLRHLKMPQRPVKTAFLYYYSKNQAEFNHLVGHERLNFATKQYRLLPKSQKEYYRMKIKQQQADFQKAYSRWRHKQNPTVKLLADKYMETGRLVATTIEPQNIPVSNPSKSKSQTTDLMPNKSAKRRREQSMRSRGGEVYNEEEEAETVPGDPSLEYGKDSKLHRKSKRENVCRNDGKRENERGKWGGSREEKYYEHQNSFNENKIAMSPEVYEKYKQSLRNFELVESRTDEERKRKKKEERKEREKRKRKEEEEREKMRKEEKIKKCMDKLEEKEREREASKERKEEEREKKRKEEEREKKRKEEEREKKRKEEERINKCMDNFKLIERERELSEEERKKKRDKEVSDEEEEEMEKRRRELSEERAMKKMDKLIENERRRKERERRKQALTIAEEKAKKASEMNKVKPDQDLFRTAKHLTNPKQTLEIRIKIIQIINSQFKYGASHDQDKIREYIEKNKRQIIVLFLREVDRLSEERKREFLGKYRNVMKSLFREDLLALRYPTQNYPAYEGR